MTILPVQTEVVLPRQRSLIISFGSFDRKPVWGHKSLSLAALEEDLLISSGPAGSSARRRLRCLLFVPGFSGTFLFDGVGEGVEFSVTLAGDFAKGRADAGWITVTCSGIPASTSSSAPLLLCEMLCPAQEDRLK